MSAIRPGLPALPAAPTAPPLRAAQAAFFRAAMGEVQAPPTQARASAPATAVASAPASETPRPGRPGQLLDIRV